MNANELADELYDLDVQASQQSLNDWGEQAATMLRQQQAEIEALKVDLKKYDELAIDDLNGKRTCWCSCGDSITKDSGASCGICTSNKQAEIEALKKQVIGDEYVFVCKRCGDELGIQFEEDK